jgi:transposase
MAGMGWRVEAERVRRAIVKLGSRGNTERLPAMIRERVLGYVVEGRAEGASWHALAEAVGLSATTLQRWQANGLEPSRDRALVAVTVDTDPVVFAAGVRVVLHSPKGWRIEGLGVGEAIDVLRELG